MTAMQAACVASASLCIIIAFGLAATEALWTRTKDRPTPLLWAALAVDMLALVPVAGLMVAS